MIPAPLVLLVLALAAFRCWRLAALDDLPALLWARDHLVGFARDGSVARPLLWKWLKCAWCSGLWWSAGWYGAWLLWPRGSLYAAVPLAISAAVGIAASLLPD